MIYRDFCNAKRAIMTAIYEHTGEKITFDDSRIYSYKEGCVSGYLGVVYRGIKYYYATAMMSTPSVIVELLMLGEGYYEQS